MECLVCPDLFTTAAVLKQSHWQENDTKQEWRIFTPWSVILCLVGFQSEQTDGVSFLSVSNQLWRSPSWLVGGLTSALTRWQCSVLRAARASPVCPAVEVPPWVWCVGTAPSKGSRWQSTQLSRGAGAGRCSETDEERRQLKHLNTEWV